ncbi:hypothetical protein Clacol_006767 [Clathrus columnatus]|uniref:glutamate--tRNA ligase n=1 Tax=Clathrus columnatus TaxID=1419009 RepID=A0AAV5AD01_9AGAM|nr:hypothetical protein Clacol_006767 [Clathrus columnatus]
MSNKLLLNPSALSFPFTVLVLAKRLPDIDISFDNTVNSAILHINSESLSTVDEILTILGKKSGLEFDVVRGEAFLSIANTLPAFTSFNDLVTAFDLLDDHLAFRTFLINKDLSLVDLVLWGALKGSSKALGVFKNNRHVHLLRWYSHLENLKETQDALTLLTEARSNNVRMSSSIGHNESESVKAKSNKIAGSFALGLPGATEGQVVTRFPPEPSGYLHIGHAKAAMLNQYFAKMYQGKLIIRFDDTNPSKEKAEFEKTILEDLELLEIVGDRVTHTSDYFDQLYDFAVKLIKSGKAYADDTEQMKMRQERMDGIASTRRDSSIEENLARFIEMTKCTVEGQRWCLRAKISVDDTNKALRDPVVYRCNITPHHRTGDKWKVYPTYDFACPIVDSIEGVTHALRTNEYRDRNPQYYWMIDALGLRKVTIWDFSRLSFIYTLLSKRKLRWFVEQGLVRGWDDPRFPTVRGIRRRGLTVESLRQYMLAQGPSQAVVSLEWDSIWALNKKVIDPIAPRFWAVEKDGLVKMQLNGVEVKEVKQNAKHKKNPDIGQKNTAYGSIIYIEQKDALSFTDQEEAGSFIYLP